MLETAFTLWGTAVSWLEVLAFVLALANIACNVWEIHWGWPLTIVASALYAWLFYASNLYGEGSVNVFFALAAVWGWWQWLRGHRANSDEPLHVEKLDAAGMKKTAAAWLLLWLACSALLHFITDSDVVWADGFVTAGSIVGTVLLGRKFIANWPTWVIVNFASVALFAYKGLALTVVLYVIFLGLALWGWRGWQQRYRQRVTAVTTT